MVVHLLPLTVRLGRGTHRCRSKTARRSIERSTDPELSQMRAVGRSNIRPRVSHSWADRRPARITIRRSGRRREHLTDRRKDVR